MILCSSRIFYSPSSNVLKNRLFARFLSSQKLSEPLRILFCGSDDFSIASLKAIHEEHTRDKSSIASIDVVCRPPKRVGVGLKSVREVPIANVARGLHLQLHEIDTFRQWQPPIPQYHPINLVIAVSFGLLVPPRILNGAEYGGLNVHPSMLPDLSGPAPLHHTLLNQYLRTGITLQTMHPRHFDQGVIVDQTPFPGIEYSSRTAPDLSLEMAPLGAEMLLRAIRKRSFIPPFEVKGWTSSGHVGAVRHAPKITREDSHISWSSWTADEILHKQHIIGPLWNTVAQSTRKGLRRERRILWSSGFSKAPLKPDQHRPFKPGTPYSIADPNHTSTSTHLNTVDGQVLHATRLKLDGEREKDSWAALQTLRLEHDTPLG